MAIKPLFGKTYDIIGKALDIAKRQHSHISSNIANIETPGYRTREIDFKKTLKNAVESERGSELSCTDSRHFKSLDLGNMNYINSSRDGKPVDIDMEMSKLAENNLRYRSAVESLLRKFNLTKNTIITGGGQ
ncbi:Flagellar basal body rod protein FlgB [Candidatus Magnetomoraceae bacterium gMMP-15]